MRFRTTLFWLHLAAGLVCGLVIGLMCFTGAALAFEKDLVAWSERDARRVAPPAADAVRLPLAELAARVAAARPEARPTGLTVSRDPRDAVAFALGRDAALYANPYTGEVRAPASTRVHDFLHLLEDCHRVLALGGDRRPIGKAINGASNLAFCFLAVTGLFLWWPRTWSRPGLKAVAVFNWRLTGKARDFNWHNTIGLWSAPILLVLTLTALPISYRWAGNLIYQLAGETPPAQPGAAGATPVARDGTPAFVINAPAPDARPLDRDAVLTGVEGLFPSWQTITFRLANAPRTDAPAGADRAARPKDEKKLTPAQPVTVIVKSADAWPRTATTTLTLHPYTGEELRREGFADFTKGRQIRTWTRFLHTGEALGAGGQLVAGLACIGGCFLVYTGFALSWRRFLGRRNKSA